MSEKPILFTAEMIRAKRADRKTVTRRVIKLPDCVPALRWEYNGISGDDYAFVLTNGTTNYSYHFVMPRYQVGDLLWNKETYCHGIEWDDCKPSEVDPLCGGNDIWYLADGPRPTDGWGKTRTGRFMPKWVARDWDEVVNVRPERVQDITEKDCWKEGIDKHEAEKLPYINKWGVGCAKATFSKLWDSLNAKRSYSWGSNPWVWRYEFKRRESKNG